MKMWSVFILMCLIPKLGLTDIVELRPLDFGQIAITSNASVSELTMDHLGNLNFDEHIRIMSRGEPGIYLASGFAGNVQLFVTALVQNRVMNPGVVSGEFVSLTALDTPVSINTRPDGTAEIPVGGTIATSGSGSMAFADAVYVSNIQVTINF